MEIDIVRKMHLEMKVKKRIEANRIIGTLGFRDHFSSHPGRHSWDLCGHPVYWWVLKMAAETKYLEKILLWTEVEEAWKDAREMSDKFVIWKRSIEECKEPGWKFVDDLKMSTSRVSTQKLWLRREEEISELLGFEPTMDVAFAANRPLVRTKSVNRMIEMYFEDDIAEMALIVTKGHQAGFFMKIPDYPEYLTKIFEFSWNANRQEKPTFYDGCGVSIHSYYNKLGGSRRAVYVEVGRDEVLDIHDEEDLELARFYMQQRLKEK